MTKLGAIMPERRPTNWSKWMSTMCRFALAGVWLWAGLAKAADPLAAENAVRAYQLAPEMLVTPVAWGLPFVEIGLAALLAFGIATRTVAAISLALFGVFIAAIGSAWARGIQIACGCFGGGGPDLRRPGSATRWRSPRTPVSRQSPPGWSPGRKVT